MERATIHGIEVFLTIVRQGSMRAAADTLGVGASAVSLQLKSLEEKLGVELLTRTTRSIELTDAGRVLFDNAAPAYRDLAGAVEKAQQIAASATDTLRLTMSRGAHMAAIAPVLHRFLSENPSINLEISWNEELVDITRKGFHAGIRLGDVLTRHMVAEQITPTISTVFFASPDYLRAHGRPEHPGDLLNHHCIRHRNPTSGQLREWTVVENGETKRIDPPARLVFDTAAGVIQAALEGHGVGWSMQATMTDHIRTGELEPLLGSCTPRLPPFYIYYQEQNEGMETLKLLIKCLKLNLETLADS